MDANITKCWDECLARLRSDIPHAQFTTWLQPLSCKLMADDKILISAPARKVMQFVEKNYWHKICAIFTEFSLPTPKLEFNNPRVAAEANLSPSQMKSFTGQIVAERNSLFPENAYAETIPPTQQSINIPEHELNNNNLANNRSYRGNNGLQEHNNFENFVIGNSNQLAHAAAVQVSEKPGLAYNPFYLYGGVGLGKTHLAQSIGNSLQNRHGYKVRYIHADDYYNEVVKAIRHNAHEEFKQKFRSLDVFIIDDVQFLQNRTRTQEELFYLFNTLMETGRQIIVTSDRFPRDIENLQDRLRSRFQWGLTVAIDSPEIELRVAILQKKAQDDNIELDTASAYYIAKHLKANVRELEGALNKIIAYTHFHSMPINNDTVRLALKDIIGHTTQPLTLEHIQKTVCDFQKVRISDMHTKTRTRNVVRARQIAMWLARELTTLSLPAIGNSFGGRDHTTVIHACKKIEELRKNQKFNQDLRILEQILKGE